MQSIFVVISLLLAINISNAYQVVNSTNKHFPDVQYHCLTGDDWKPRNLVPCAHKVMIAVDGSASNRHLETVKQFLINEMLADHSFNQPHNRLGISHYFTGPSWYKMGAVWGDFGHMQHARDFVRSWQHEPETRSVLYNAILDLSKSWVEYNENGKVSFVIFTSTLDKESLQKARPYLDVLKKRGHLTIVTLGNTGSSGQLPSSVGTHIKWANPEHDSRNWRSTFWQDVYRCGNQHPKKSCTCG